MDKYFHIVRNDFGDYYTMGKIDFEGLVVCDTLEDKDRDLTFDLSADQVNSVKVPGQTAIPYGTYPLNIGFSQRFQRDMVRVLNVPGFDGILLHGGNTDKDTHGCVLCGEKDNEGHIHNCKPYVDRIFGIVHEQLELKNDIYLTVQKT